MPALPYLPELPGRGVGADMIGRAASLLVELPVEVQPSGWRFTDRPGRDAKRARDHLARDLDGLEEGAQGYEGPFKIQACGPWTLAGAVELRHGDKTLADAGAVRDLVESFGEGSPRTSRRSAGGCRAPRRSWSSWTSRACPACWRAPCRRPRASGGCAPSRRRWRWSGSARRWRRCPAGRSRSCTAAPPACPSR
nr:hypothetical protein GCM10020093_056660 [Planobispora longispora]